MEITNSFYRDLRKHCTAELLNFVGIIEPSDENNNIWDLTSIVAKRNNIYEQLRIAYVFEQLGGTLIFKNKPIKFTNITKDLDKNICNNIRLFWIHNNANGVMPIYDVGAISVPPILPKYTYRPYEKGGFVIEKLYCGEYRHLNGEHYLLEQEAKERVVELNAEENQNEL